jgi:hypothetical protein
LHERNGKPLSGGVHKTSGDIEFWKESIQNLSNMYFVHQDGKKFVPPSLTNWIRTLEGLSDLYEILVGSGHCKFFLPR